MIKIRKEKALLLEKEIITQLSDLYMTNTVFKCEFNDLSELSPNGLDSMKFMITTNVGQNLHALSDVASGGELSRLMLGMKCIFTRLAGVKTIIFDEVDTDVYTFITKGNVGTSSFISTLSPSGIVKTVSATVIRWM